MGGSLPARHVPLHKCKAPSWVVHQDGLDIILGEVLDSHQRNDVLEDMRVAVSSVASESRPGTNIMRNDDLVSVAVPDELSNHVEAYSVIGEVDRRFKDEVGRFDPEQIELDDAAGIRQPEQSVELEYRPLPRD